MDDYLTDDESGHESGAQHIRTPVVAVINPSQHESSGVQTTVTPLDDTIGDNSGQHVSKTAQTADTVDTPESAGSAVSADCLTAGTQPLGQSVTTPEIFGSLRLQRKRPNVESTGISCDDCLQLTSRVKTLEAVLKTKDNVIISLRQERDQLVGRVTELAAQLAIKDKTIDSFNKQLEGNDEQMADTEAKLKCVMQSLYVYLYNFLSHFK